MLDRDDERFLRRVLDCAGVPHRRSLRGRLRLLACWLRRAFRT